LAGAALTGNNVPHVCWGHAGTRCLTRT
jgi:hypothetical protein